MSLLDEPRGWRRLQALAQQERNPERLALLLDQMNSLLREHEKMQEAAGLSEQSSKDASPDPETFRLTGIHTWQYDA